MERVEWRGDTFGGQGYVSQFRFQKLYVIIRESANRPVDEGGYEK